MKLKLFILTSLISVILAGCGESLASQISMTVSVEPSAIILSTANSLRQKAVIDYSIVNNSDENLPADKYQLVLGLGKKGELSYTLLQKIDKPVAAKNTLTGSYEHTFTKIIGDDGEHEIKFVLSKRDGQYTQPIKEITAPVTIEYK